MGSIFDGLTRPERDRLSLYVIGSGYGESSVLVLPRRGVIAVDTCMDGSAHLTRALLEELEIARIDLLLVTHSDLDHVRGLPELLDAVEVGEVWRFPGAADVRTLASKWLRNTKQLRRPQQLGTEKPDERLQVLHAAMTRLDALAETNTCAEACADLRPWRLSPQAPVVATCLAPSQHDQRRSRAALDELIRMEAGSPKLADAILRFLGKRSKTIGAQPNVLSLAAIVEWQAADLRIVLGGDVEKGDGTDHSGWRGILTSLDRRRSRSLLRHARAVKVAHHGSRGALELDAWDEHVRVRPSETWAIIAPFWSGDVILPDAEVLRSLHGRAVRLAICDATPVKRPAKAAGWTPDRTVDEVCTGPVIALSWSSDGACSAARGQRAAVYTV